MNGDGRIVVALGGNALSPRGERPDAATQRTNVARAAEALAPVLRERPVVITHGNGPQVGLLALQAESYKEVPPYPLDILDAESQGMIGYLLLEAVGAALDDPDQVAALLTRVVVAADDPAFARPTKFIGAVMDEETAARGQRERGWSIAMDGSRWRRVVPSPEPIEVVEARLISSLCADGYVVMCGGGGGIPVIRRNGELVGVEAVVDKDLTAALLAERIGATTLVMLTDVPGIALDFATESERWLERITPSELMAMDLPAGSMGPKALAAARFVDATGGTAVIASLSDAALACEGIAGTVIEGDRETDPPIRARVGAAVLGERSAVLD